MAASQHFLTIDAARKPTQTADQVTADLNAVAVT
jgi:hypothetical protein